MFFIIWQKPVKNVGFLPIIDIFRINYNAVLKKRHATFRTCRFFNYQNPFTPFWSVRMERIA